MAHIWIVMTYCTGATHSMLWRRIERETYHLHFLRVSSKSMDHVLACVHVCEVSGVCCVCVPRVISLLMYVCHMWCVCGVCDVCCVRVVCVMCVSQIISLFMYVCHVCCVCVVCVLCVCHVSSPYHCVFHACNVCVVCIPHVSRIISMPV